MALRRSAVLAVLGRSAAAGTYVTARDPQRLAMYFAKHPRSSNSSCHLPDPHRCNRNFIPPSQNFDHLVVTI